MGDADGKRIRLVVAIAFCALLVAAFIAVSMVLHPWNTGGEQNGASGNARDGESETQQPDQSRGDAGPEGGVWVDSTFAWPDGQETASVSAYFADAPYLDQLEAVASDLSSMAEVDSAYPCFFENGPA